MFAKLFQKPTQSQTGDPHMASPDFTPRVVVHYGIPSNASILGYDPIQRLLAVGTLDGRIKVVGGDNIECLLLSPKAVPFKNLEFLQNQGFLVSVSNENEIQVWDLEKRRIASSVKWESSITAFSVIHGTNYMYAGDEFGFISVLKYDSQEGNILQLPYHIPPNLIIDGAGIALPDHPSIVGVLSQPCSSGNRVLIAFQNGLMILWDVTEDKAVDVKGCKDFQLKQGTVVNLANNDNNTHHNVSLEIEEEEKEISSHCWVSPDGSVLAVGYVDGDILLWNLSVPDNDKGQGTQKALDDFVKIQMSSSDKRLPVIVLRWSPNNDHGCQGHLFAYGGEDIGSEEVLTILDLDWSSGLSKLKCVERVSLRLHGSFADVFLIPNAYNAKNKKATSLFVLTNPGGLHYYEYASLSVLKSESGKNHSPHALQYQSVIPTLEPYMTVGKLFTLSSEMNILNATLTETASPEQQQSDNTLAGESAKWPMTGGVPYQKTTEECNNVKSIYVGGYQDGSVRIWDATFPVLSLVSVLGFEAMDIQLSGASVSISSLDFCCANLTLAIGNVSGMIFLHRLQGNSTQTAFNVVTDGKQDVHQYKPEEKHRCSAVYSIVNSSVRALKFTVSGDRLIAGFECGQVAVFDTTSPSVLFVMDCLSSSKSPLISLAVENISSNSDVGTGNGSEREIVLALSRDAHLVLIDTSTGNTINSQAMCPKEKSTALSLHLLETKHSLAEASRNDAENSDQNQSILSKAKEPSQILLCCEEVLYLYSLKSLIQGDNAPIHELKLEKTCSWTSIFKRDGGEYGLIIVYQNGEIELRYFPEFKLLGKTSMTAILRWSFKNNMDKTMSTSDRGQICAVNGCEFALASFLAYENEFRIPETLPCLHDKSLAAAADANIQFELIPKKPQSNMPGFISNVMKGLKGHNDEHDMNYSEAREAVIAHLEKIFSRFPFSSSYDLGELDLELDDDVVVIDEPVVVVVNEPVPSSSSSQKSKNDTKEKEDERAKLFEGSSTDTKPKLRTREEIIAKYRGTDAAAVAAEAKDKLLERQEKLERLSKNSEELQSGAENFASLAQQIARNMEKRSWWHI